MASTSLNLHYMIVTVGDELTFEGVYERQTFWQWITRQPRKLKIFKIHTM